MAGIKRDFEKMESQEPKSSVSPIVSMFESFREEIDEHHDRRERILKASKDITQLSKKIIFALQRTKEIGTPLADKRAISDVARLKQQISDIFTAVSADLQNINSYRYQRNISSGIQEYMEAVLFEHYLVTQSMLTYEQAASTVPAEAMLTYEDYALGLFDMTGELMKIAITYMAMNGRLPGAYGRSVLTDMQTIRTQLELMSVGGSYALNKDFEAKLRVTKQSVEKVEGSVYSMMVRGKERPKGWRPDEATGHDGVKGDVESY